MKFSAILATVIAAASTADAFVPQPRPAFGLALSERVDSADLVKEALEISKKFGASSPEARLAWEAVEEVDASDNSEATKGSLDDCDVDAPNAEECDEYANKMVELQSLIESTRPTLAALQTTAAAVKQVKLAVPEEKTGGGVPSTALTAALAEAKKITADKGLTSAEAKVAWETVEEIAASGSQANALGGALSDDECLVDAATEACAALEELNRVLELRKTSS